MVTDIIFDWGGVIAPSTTKDIARAISKKCGTNEEDAYKTIVEIDSKYETVANYEDYYEEISKRLCIKAKDVETLLNNTSVGEVFKIAKNLSKDYKIHLLTNQVTPKSNAIRKNNDLSFFSNLFFSNEIGRRKPEKELFEFVIKIIDQKPEHIVLVDDRQVNLKSATLLGIKAILFKNVEGLKKELGECGVKFS